MLRRAGRDARPTLDNVQCLCEVFGVRQSEFFARGEEIADQERERLRQEILDQAKQLAGSDETEDKTAELISNLEPEKKRLLRKLAKLGELA